MTLTRAIGSPQSIAIHTILFLLGFLSIELHLLPLDTLLLNLNTVVSLEAIYLALFIQITVNYASQSLEEVEQDIDEIQEDVDEIQKDIDEMQEEDTPSHIKPITLNEVKTDLEKLLRDIERLEKS